MFDNAMNYHQCLSNFWNIIWMLIWQMLFWGCWFPMGILLTENCWAEPSDNGSFLFVFIHVLHFACSMHLDENWKCLHQESNLGCRGHNTMSEPQRNDSSLRWDDSPQSGETIHPLRWDDSPPQVRRFTPWGETIHPLKWHDSPPEVRRFTPWGETSHPLRWDDLPLEVKRLRHEILSRSRAARIRAPGLSLFQMKCMACMGLGTWCCNCRICFYQP